MTYSAIYRDWAWSAYLRLANPPSVDDYQCRINLDYLHGMNPDFSDIRFTDLQGRPLSHWIETTDSSSATVWVKIENQDAGILLYYGNPMAEDGGNADSTFLAYSNCDTLDDFSTVGTPTVVDNTIYLNGYPETIDYSWGSLGRVRVLMHVKWVEYVHANWMHFRFHGSSTTPSSPGAFLAYAEDVGGLAYWDNGQYNSVSDDSINVWHRLQVDIDCNTNSSNISLDGVQVATDADFYAGDTTVSGVNIGRTISSPSCNTYVGYIAVAKYLATEPTASIVTITPNIANYAYDYVDVVAAAVQKTLAGQYNILLQDTVGGKYDGLLQQAIAAQYDVLQQDTIEGKSNILIQDTITGQTDILIQQAIDAVSDILQQQAITGKYTIDAAFVQKLLQANYDILLQATATGQFSLLVKQVLEAHHDILYNAGMTGSYDMLQQSTFAGKYDILVTAILSGQYDIIEYVQKLLEGKYGIDVQKLTEGKYDTLMQKILAGDYDIEVIGTIIALLSYLDSADLIELTSHLDSSDIIALSSHLDGSDTLELTSHLN